MTVGRDVTMLVAGVVVGMVLSYIFRDSIAGLLRGAGTTKATRAYAHDYYYQPMPPYNG